MHIQWLAMLLVLLFRGPGTFSVDHLIARRFPVIGGEFPVLSK